MSSLRFRLAPLTGALLLASACSSPTDDDVVAAVSASSLGTVAHAAANECSTLAVEGLTRQLVDELQCLAGDTLESIEGLSSRLELADEVKAAPFLDRHAATALRKVLEDAPTRSLRVTSALRTLPQQYMVFQQAKDGRCGIPAAATPGSSKHESGLGLDVPRNVAPSWEAAMKKHDFLYLGTADPVHFTYTKNGTDVTRYSVLAFKRLWNRNHPNASDRLPEAGGWDGDVERALRASPAAGFPVSARCDTPRVAQVSGSTFTVTIPGGARAGVHVVYSATWENAVTVRDAETDAQVYRSNNYYSNTPLTLEGGYYDRLYSFVVEHKKGKPKASLPWNPSECVMRSDLSNKRQVVLGCDDSPHKQYANVLVYLSASDVAPGSSGF